MKTLVPQHSVEVNEFELPKISLAKAKWAVTIILIVLMCLGMAWYIHYVNKKQMESIHRHETVRLHIPR